MKDSRSPLLSSRPIDAELLGHAAFFLDSQAQSSLHILKCYSGLLVTYFMV